MSYRAEFASRISIGGESHEGTSIIEGQNRWGYNETAFPAAKAGTLSTRGDNNTGTLTMEGGHGITTGAIIDIYWVDVDSKIKCQHKVTVGTVSVNFVPFDLGIGDNLPVLTTAITAMVHVTEFIAIAIDSVAAFVASATGRVSIHVYDDGGLYVETFVVDPGTVYSWHNEMGFESVFNEADITSLRMTQASTSEITLKMDAIQV